MTSTQIIASVNMLCKINLNDTVLQTFVADAVNIAFYDVARENPWPELLRDTTIANVIGSLTNGTLFLPTNFLRIDRVRFISGTYKWRLPDRKDLVPPAPIDGKPRAFYILQSSNPTIQPYDLKLEPYTGVSGGDSLEYSWFQVPTLFDGAAGTLSNNWDNEIIKKAEHYVYTYQGKIDQAKEIWATTLGQMSKASQSQGQ